MGIAPRRVGRDTPDDEVIEAQHHVSRHHDREQGAVEVQGGCGSSWNGRHRNIAHQIL